MEHRTDEQLLRFVEDLLYLIPLGPRRDGYDVLSDTRIDLAGAQALAEATELCWQAILAQDAVGFGLGVRRSFEAQVAMFPHRVNPTIAGLIERCRDVALGWKVSGAGGGCLRLRAQMTSMTHTRISNCLPLGLLRVEYEWAR